MTAHNLLILASEGGFSADSPWAKLAVPIGIVIFIGSVFMLVRSNLGTRRGYLVSGASLFSFLFVISLFWMFGAWGSPENSGPTYLPGQENNAYLPTWYPFAQDSALATEDGSPYAVAAQYPDGFGEPPAELIGDPDDEDSENRIREGEDATLSFFSDLESHGDYQNLLYDSDTVVEGETRYAEAENGRPVIAVTFAASCQMDGEGNLPEYCDGLEIGDPIPEDAVNENGDSLRDERIFFAMYDEGNPYWPSFITVVICTVLFVLHMVLLARDELAEYHEAHAATDAEEGSAEAPDREVVKV